MKTFTELVERLTVDPRFRYDCGFDPFGRVPSIATFSRFYNQVAASGILDDLSSKLVHTSEQMNPLDINAVANDSTTLKVYEMAKPRKDISNDGQSANWGSKLDTNGNQITWFGYKVHMAVDVKSELPLAIEVTSASVNDGKMAESILKHCQKNLTSKPQY